MKIAVASDHAGFPMKATVIEVVKSAGHEVVDLGTNDTEAVDYPDYAEKLGRLIHEDPTVQRGILLCGSGVGASIVANKIHGIYAGVCHDTYSAHQAVEHDNINVLCLGARIIGPELIREVVLAYLAARFIGNDPGQERHKHRVQKIRTLESKNFLPK